MTWFSSKVRLVVLVDPEGAVRYSDSVYIFTVGGSADTEGLRARAFERALQLGRQQEEEFLNSDGDRVRWRLKEVVTLDMLGDELRDGMEICSDPVELELGTVMPFYAVITPEDSQPTSSI